MSGWAGLFVCIGLMSIGIDIKNGLIYLADVIEGMRR